MDLTALRSKGIHGIAKLSSFGHVLVSSKRMMTEERSSTPRLVSYCLARFVFIHWFSGPYGPRALSALTCLVFAFGLFWFQVNAR